MFDNRYFKQFSNCLTLKSVFPVLLPLKISQAYVKFEAHRHSPNSASKVDFWSLKFFIEFNDKQIPQLRVWSLLLFIEELTLSLSTNK